MEQFEDISTAPPPVPDAETNNSGFLTEIRAYPKIWVYCCGLMSAALLTGFDTVIVGTVTALPPFQ